MSSILVVPDIHLKPALLKRVQFILQQDHHIDEVVFLGDYVDDWYKSDHTNLIKETFYHLEELKKQVPCTFLLGNHDIPYLTQDFAHYSATDPANRSLIKDRLLALEPHFLYKKDNVLFSHAGVLSKALSEHLNRPVNITNKEDINLLKRLYHDSLSPYWIRPGDFYVEQFRTDEDALRMFQVVGHTPVPSIKNTGQLVLTDTDRKSVV